MTLDCNTRIYTYLSYWSGSLSSFLCRASEFDSSISRVGCVGLGSSARESVETLVLLGCQTRLRRCISWYHLGLAAYPGPFPSPPLSAPLLGWMANVHVGCASRARPCSVPSVAKWRIQNHVRPPITCARGAGGGAGRAPKRTAPFHTPMTL